MPPLVSVVCLCYNHSNYIEEAVLSVIYQTYPAVELVIVDDASTDNSVEIIEGILQKFEKIKFLRLENNMGNCAAFNRGFALCKGEYIIDLAADDMLMQDRIERGVKALVGVGPTFGVQFSDAQLIDNKGEGIGLLSDTYPHQNIPQGDIYKELISRYFISGPTMMIRREVLEKLKGYDESLAYEDFDFWIRSSREFRYLYVPEVLVKRRILANSMRSHQFQKGSAQLLSTFKICKKIKGLNRNHEENKALRMRIRYEIRVCLKVLDFGLLIDYLKLLISIKA